MNLDKFKLLSEAEDTYHLQAPNGSKFTFNKKGLSEKAKRIISGLKQEKEKFADGGMVELERQKQKKLDDSNADNVILKSLYDRTDFSDPEQVKKFKAKEKLLGEQPDSFAKGGQVYADGGEVFDYDPLPESDRGYPNVIIDEITPEAQPEVIAQVKPTEQNLLEKVWGKFKTPNPQYDIFSEMTPEKVELISKNVGIPVASVEKAAVRGLAGAAEDMIKPLSKEVEALPTVYQGYLANIKDTALNSFKESLSPEMLKKLNNLNPEELTHALYNSPQMRVYRNAVNAYKRMVNTGPLGSPQNLGVKQVIQKVGGQKFAEGGEVEDEGKGFFDTVTSFLNTFSPASDAQATEKPVVEAPIQNVSVTPPVQDKVTVFPVGGAQVMPEPIIQQPKAPNNQFANDYIGQLKSANRGIDSLYNEANQQLKQLPTAMELQEKYKAEDDRNYQDVKNSKIDPGKWWNSQTTGNKIMATLGVVLSSLGNSMQGQPGAPNIALDLINKAIDRDIDAQREDKSTKMNLWKMNREKANSDLEANLMTRNQIMSGLKFQTEKFAQKLGNDQAIFKANQLITAANQEQEKNRMLLAALGDNAENTGGNLPGSEASQNAKLKFLQMKYPKIYEQEIKKVLPGLGTTSQPVSGETRSKVIANEQLIDGLKDLQATATKGTTLPLSEQAAINKSKIDAMMPAFRTAYGLGTMSESDFKFINNLLVDPGQIRSEVAYKKYNTLVDKTQRSQDLLLKGYGFKPFMKSPQVDEKQEAIKWLQANPNDPRAAAVRKKLGM